MKIQDLSISYTGDENSEHLLIIQGAMAAPAKIYKAMAEYLANQGVAVVYFDPRGVGANSSFRDSSIEAWCHDLEMLRLHFAEQGKQVHYLGHSIGGQIFGRLKNPQEFNKVVFLCTSTGVWWKCQHLPTFFQSAFVMNVYIPISNLVFGYTNAELIGMGMNLPKSAASEWAKWCRSKNYLDDHRDTFNYDHYRQLNKNILNILVADDPIATTPANQSLKNIYANCQFEDYQVVSEKKIGHLGFSHAHVKPHWEALTAYILDGK